MKIAAVPENFVEWLLKTLGLVPTPIIDTFHSVIVARAILVATRLGVFDALGESARSVDEIAEALAVDAHALEKLLNVLVACGYLRIQGGRYALTRLTRKWLLRDVPGSLRDNLLLRFLEWEAIDTAEDFVRTGQPLDVHDRISGEEWDIYQRGMRCLARLSAGEVVRRVKIPATASAMLDVGGGHGTYSVAFCERLPQLSATILDLPEAVASAAPILAEANMGNRVKHWAGNALSEDLGSEKWDLIFISHLIHHFDAATNESLIRRAARALRMGGVLVILDVLRQETPSASSQTGALLDLYFAITSKSGTFSLREITGWQERSGLQPGKAIHLRSAPGITVLTAGKPTD